MPPVQISSVDHNRLPLSASLSAAFICALFGANAIAIKVSLTGLGIYTTAAIRFSLAALALFLWGVLRKTPLAVSHKQILQLSVISLVFFLQMSLFYHGQNLTTASHGTLIANIQPFLVMLFAHFFLVNDRIHPAKIGGLVCGFGGVALLLADTADTVSASLRGDLLILSAVLLWAGNVTYIKKIFSGYSPLQITLYPMLFTIPLFLCGSFFWDSHMVTDLTPRVVTALLYQSFVSASFGFLMWNSLIQKYGATAVHSFIFIMPISGTTCGVLLLGEPFSLSLLLALALVTFGLVILHSAKT